MKLPLVCCFAMLLSTTSTFAQSLNPNNPAPLQPGINSSTADNTVGTQYWYFMGEPGQIHVHAQFKSMGILGNPSTSTLTVTLSDAANTWHTTKVLTSTSKATDGNFDGDLKKPTKVIVTVAPPVGGLLRMGGDYELQATGAVTFGQKSTADPIIGTYKQMNGYTKNLGACKFSADGTIQTATGPNGAWKLFDSATQTYVIDIDGESRVSLQLMPGRGLVDGSSIVFQSLQ
jgi:hypothetical protein